MDEKYKLLGHFEIFDKKSIEKLNFELFLEKLMLEIEPWKITSFFYNTFFHFGGGGGAFLFHRGGAYEYNLSDSKDHLNISLF